ncbi:MAG TPA: hypothetical protein PKK94_00395 [Leptospiraceae bacterium]|nr:hypothetical protein [Leptospiraceae bacterium]
MNFKIFIPMLILASLAFCKTEKKKNTAVLAGAFLLSQTKTNPYLYVSITSHNEESSSSGDPVYDALPGTNYTTSRNLVKSMIDTIAAKGAKINYESDWRFLNAIKTYEPNGASDINNKNLLRYIKEDKGFEIDPHAHESTENYADVAYRISQLGVTPSANVGGFTYNATSGSSTPWENMQNGLAGRINTSYTWKPTTLVLAGSADHKADDYSYGAWKPKSVSDFYTHDSTKNLVFIGSGCSNVVTSTSAASDHISAITRISDGIKNGTYAKGKFYSANIMINQRDYSTDYITKVGQIIDGLKSRVDAKEIQWVFHSEKKTAWETVYSSQNFQLTCP